MTLTEDKKQKFIEWLADKTNINFYQCGVCGCEDMAVLNEVIFLTGAAASYPVVGLICTNCKNIQTFEATDSGVMDEDLDPSAIVCQECFRVEATMQKDDGIYKYSECYNRD